MNKAEIKTILSEHNKWLEGKGGTRANLSGADLYRANLSRADLSGANLSGANLYRANLSRADLSSTDLSGAYLSGADLSGANLYRAYLSGADLSGANLYRANLCDANIEFIKLPSIKMLASFNLKELSDNLTLELMRRDAWAHPNPQAFDAWANGGCCPYKNEDRYWLFLPRKKLWKPGPPEMRDSDLIMSICREKGWKVNGYIE